MHRNSQSLEKVGPVFSTRDEEQRAITEEIIAGRIKPVQKIKLNLNIPGLDKKPYPGRPNTSYYRLIHPVSSFSRVGFGYVWINRNHTRFLAPVFCFAVYYYGGTTLSTAIYNIEHQNFDEEKCYLKMQNYAGHYADRLTLMA